MEAYQSPGFSGREFVEYILKILALHFLVVVLRNNEQEE